MGGHHGIRQKAPLSKKQELRREKLLRVLPKVIQGMDDDLKGYLYGDSRHTFEENLTELRRVHNTLLKIKRAHDISTIPFFPGYQGLNKEDDFLESESLDQLSGFLERGLPTLTIIFEKRSMRLPVALERLHKEYHGEKAPALKQQSWCTVFPGMAEFLGSATT